MISVIVFLSYSNVDKSITLSYSNQGYESARVDIDNLVVLIEREWVGMDVEVVQDKMKNATINKKGIIPQTKMEDDLIWYGDVRFIFSSGKLEKIEY